MKPSIIVVAATTALISTTALAAKVSPLSAPPPKGTGLPTGQCIRSHDIRNHTIADAKTLLIDGGDKHTYRVTMAGSCLAGSTSSDPIGSRRPPGASIICKPIDMDIAISKSGFESRCIVESIVRLTPKEVEALPKKLRP